MAIIRSAGLATAPPEGAGGGGGDHDRSDILAAQDVLGGRDVGAIVQPVKDGEGSEGRKSPARHKGPHRAVAFAPPLSVGGE